MRRAMLAGGGGVLALAWSGAPHALAGHGFAAHMIMHMAVVAGAAPLIATGIAGSRFDPSRWLPRMFAALPASLVELVTVWAWHAPLLHDLARTRSPVFMLEQASFLLAGLALWLACLGGGRDARSAAGILGLLLTSMHMTLLGALLALAPRPFYAHEPEGEAGLADQHLGGIVMLVAGGAVYLAGGVMLAARLLSERGTAKGGERLGADPQ